MSELSREKKRLFSLGQTVATPGALAALEKANMAPQALLWRHVTGDWGDLCDEDKQENELALRKDLRIFSAYILPTQVKIWIITEWDRSVSTLLLPEEY